MLEATPNNADNAARRYVLQVWNHFCDLIGLSTLPNFTVLKLCGSLCWQAGQGSETQYPVFYAGKGARTGPPWAGSSRASGATPSKRSCGTQSSSPSSCHVIDGRSSTPWPGRSWKA